MEAILRRETTAEDLNVLLFDDRSAMPPWLDLDRLAAFLHESLKPWNDTEPDIRRGLDFALSSAPGRGGFVALGMVGHEVVGAVVVLRTGMGGYVPRHLLLFIAVAPAFRGQGIGERLLRRAVDACDGDVALHVEYDNPAKRLYERVGFHSDYAEMRYRR